MALGASALENHDRFLNMAFKSFYLAAGIVSTVAIPFYAGATGAHHLPAGPCIVAANHSSFLDGPLLALAYAKARLRPLHMIAYDEPFNHWLMGWILRSGGAIPFTRGNRESQGQMLKTASDWLAAGEAVGIFPEGHINQQPILNRPRSGVALLALETGAPIIPAAIIGSSETLPLGSNRPRALRNIRIRFGPEVPLMHKETEYPHLTKPERRRMANNLGYRIMTAIGLLSGRQTRDEQPDAVRATD